MNETNPMLHMVANSWKYGAQEVVWCILGTIAEARDSQGNVLHHGTRDECVKFLADAGNPDARKELGL